MDKSKTKETNNQPRSTKHSLDNASQMNKVESAQASAISSDIQVEAYNENAMEAEMDKIIHPLRKRIRIEVLEELWAADKLNKDGYWYVKLTDVIKIIGE